MECHGIPMGCPWNVPWITPWDTMALHGIPHGAPYASYHGIPHEVPHGIPHGVPRDAHNCFVYVMGAPTPWHPRDAMAYPLGTLWNVSWVTPWDAIGYIMENHIPHTMACLMVNLMGYPMVCPAHHCDLYAMGAPWEIHRVSHGSHERQHGMSIRYSMGYHGNLRERSPGVAHQTVYLMGRPMGYPMGYPMGHPMFKTIPWFFPWGIPWAPRGCPMGYHMIYPMFCLMGVFMAWVAPWDIPWRTAWDAGDVPCDVPWDIPWDIPWDK